jgi:serine/threonine-protein kinase SRPK3
MEIGSIEMPCLDQEYAHNLPDLHPGNLLLSLSDDDSHNLEEIKSICGTTQTAAITRVDGEPITDNLPRYGVLERDFDPSVFSAHIKVADFGDAFFQDQPPEETSYLGPYVLPEYASPQLISISSDVWLFGCAMYQIISGHDLFGVPDDPASLVASRISEALRKPLDFLIEDWTRNMKDLPVLHEHPTQTISRRVRELVEGSKAQVMKNRRQDFRDADMKNLEAVLEMLLVYDPKRRPSINQVLQDPAMEHFKT